MKISEKELEYRKNKIVHKAFYLFCEYGIDKVTIEKIAQESHVGVASVYRYFNTKADLLWQTQQLLWRDIRTKMEEVMGTGLNVYCNKSGYEQVEAFLQGFEHLFTEYSQYILFAADYKLYIVRERLKLTEKNQNELLDPVWLIFYGAIKKGRQDGSLQVKGELSDVFFTMWGILRGFTEEIVVYDRMVDGENQWKTRYQFVKAILLDSLKGGQRSEVFCRPYSGLASF